MLVDTPRNLEKLRINLNVTLPRLPCYVLALDTEDALGSGVEDFQEKSIMKIPEREGCRITGYINVPKVPGNFHLSTHGRNVQPSEVDMQHSIGSIFFTDSPKVYYPPGSYIPAWRTAQNNVEAELLSARLTEDDADVVGLFRPLDGIAKVNALKKLGVAVSYEYYIQIVPTVLEFPDGRTKHTYQFTYNFNDAHTPSGKTPSIYFKYEISPITVKITRGRGSLVHFLLQLCAIVGGIFTVSGLIAGVTARVLHRFYSGIKLE